MSRAGKKRARIEFAGGNHRDHKRFMPSTTRKGTTDIHAVVNGRHLSIEVVLLMAYVRVKFGDEVFNEEETNERKEILAQI